MGRANIGEKKCFGMRKVEEEKCRGGIMLGRRNAR